MSMAIIAASLQLLAGVVIVGVFLFLVASLFVMLAAAHEAAASIIRQAKERSSR